MRLFPSSLLSLLFLSYTQAAEIVAWKIRLHDILEYNAELEDLRVLEKPPEETVFFNKGDTLRAFDKKQIETFLPTEPALEWAVWNETTGRLVTKSDWSGYSQIYLRFPNEQPLQIRTTLSCQTVKDANKPPALDAKPLMQFSVLSRSGEITDLNWKQGDSSLNFEVEPTCGEDHQTVNIRVAGSAQHGEDTRIYLNTAVTTDSGKSLWIARDHDGRSGLDLMIQNRVEFIDGTPAEEAILIQRDGKVETVDTRQSRHFKTERISDTHWLLKAHIHRLIFQQLVDQEIPGGNDADPFAPVPHDEATRKKSFKLKETMAPEALKGRIPGPALDARVIFQKSGISVGKEDFLGYDSRTQTLYFYTTKREEIDKVEMLINFGGCGQPRMVFATWELQGRSCIMARSGELAKIARISKGGPNLRFFEIEPTIGANEDMASLRLRAEENSNPDQAFLLNSAHTFAFGSWKTVAEHIGAGGKQEARIKLELIDKHAD